MHQISIQKLLELQASHEPPCISLYQPTHRQHPENEQDPIRYRNLLTQIETSLGEKYPTREVRELLEKFQELPRDGEFWNHRTDGLAIFSSPERFEFFELQRPVRELLVVADSFHTKPLIRILQSADGYQILCLNRREAKLYEGNRDRLDEVELTDIASTIEEVLGDERSPAKQPIGSYGTGANQPHAGGTVAHHAHGPQTKSVEADTLKFFRAVDRGILESHSRPSGLPLMLAALPEYHEPFRRSSHNPFLLSEGITKDPAALDLSQLREQAWQKLEPIYLTRLKELKDKFEVARSRETGSADLSDVARAVVADRVETLLLEADRVIPGSLDRNTGAIQSGDLSNPHVDDMLDDLAELVIAKGGEVVVVPQERMPTASGLAAIYRF